MVHNQSTRSAWATPQICSGLPTWQHHHSIPLCRFSRQLQLENPRRRDAACPREFRSLLAGAIQRVEKFQTDPHWRDNLLFYEYFHGDLGAGVGASHQTGWTGLVETMTRLFAGVDGRAMLEGGKASAFRK